MFPQLSVGRVARIACVLALAPASQLLYADDFTQTNLVSDLSNVGAVTVDPNLKNPWGVSFSATSPFWVSNQVTNTSTLYNGAGTITPLVVAIPTVPSPPNGPTGQVQNSAAGVGAFIVGTTPASFIFDTLGGQIDGWNGGSTATVEHTTPGAIYTGLALASVGTTPYLYAANSNTGEIRVFDATWTDVTTTTFAGKFVDPSPIAGYVAFNVQLIGSQLYVTYAQLNGKLPQPGGYVDVFDTNGNFIKRFATSGPLEAPWGVVIAPPGFGSFGNDLLIGNFGNGEILVYDPTTGTFISTLDGPNGQPLVNPFLWALETRENGGSGSDPNAVYFTAGINNQQDGLFGKIDPVPEPATILETASGLIALALLRFRRRC